MAQPFTVTGQATAAASGTCEATITAPTHRPITVTRMAAMGDSTTAPELRVYRNGVLVDSSAYANSDVSEVAPGTLVVYPGDVLRAAWSKCSTGARMTLVVDGSAD